MGEGLIERDNGGTEYLKVVGSKEKEMKGIRKAVRIEEAGRR